MDARNQVVMSQVMLPHQANVAGNVHGGEIMKFMDMAAGACAMKYARSNCVTARVDELVFHIPIFVGALVTCTANIAYVGNTSMDVYVEVYSEDMESGNGPGEGSMRPFYHGFHESGQQAAESAAVYSPDG